MNLNSGRYETALAEIRLNPRTWLVTGVAGFIGSNILEALLRNGQLVKGLDNFATGFQHNLDDVRAAVGDDIWTNFQFTEGDITDLETCTAACHDVDIVLHNAALGSVPRSLKNPIATNRANIDGFLNMLVAAKDNGVKRFVYAASSSTYGDHPALPKVEDHIGHPLSPYAVTKYVNELYAHVFALSYGFKTIGLRYFNVFGRRQNPGGDYAAVIPKWVGQLMAGEVCTINGDGNTSRDFSYIENVVQANILAGTVSQEEAIDQIYNIAFGGRTTLNQLYQMIQSELARFKPEVAHLRPKYLEFRPGDVLHSQADIEKARHLLGYEPLYPVEAGIAAALEWYMRNERV